MHILHFIFYLILVIGYLVVGDLHTYKTCRFDVHTTKRSLVSELTSK